MQNAQKYKPLTYIFDIGGSFESLTRIFGGSYLNVGHESRDFTINPFSLEPTRDNLQFLYSLFRVLIEGERYKLDFKEERQLYSAIERMYVLEPDQRTVSNLAEIVGELKDRLHRWTRAGQYGFLFDNVKDTLTFSQFQTFNFHGWNDTPELLEPLLFYVLHRASNEIADPNRLATFKMFLLDEAWLFIRNETIRGYVTQAQKTWRKHNAAMVLATQSVKELAASGMLTVVAESCPTKIFLANPDMEPAVYRDAFGLNDTELALIADLVPPGQMLIRKHDGSKKVHLNVDSLSYWMATNNSRDNVLKYRVLRPLRRHRRSASFSRRAPVQSGRPIKKRANSGRSVQTDHRFPSWKESVNEAGNGTSRDCNRVERNHSPVARRKLSPHDLLSQPGHREHPSEGEVHHAHSVAGDREDHRGRNGRQRILDHRYRREFLLRASGEGGDSFQSESDHRQRQHLLIHAGGCFQLRTRDPDLKVIIQPADGSSIAASTGPAQYVPATEVAAVENQLQALQSRVVQTVDQYKDTYRAQLKFDYRYKGNEAPFNIASIYHDDRFTYIKSDAQEKFTLYEVRDGAPNLINYDLREGTYVIPKILDKGYVEIGKKRMDFERKQGQ